MNKLKSKIKDDNERGAREAILEDIFNDFNRSRFTVYKMNFVRGLFFGFGSILGGTVVIALLIWILSTTGALIPGAASFVDGIIDTIQRK